MSLPAGSVPAQARRCHIDIRQREDWYIVHVSGVLTASTTGELRSQVTELLSNADFAESVRWLAFDLTGLSDIDESGIQVLTSLWKRGVRRGTERFAIAANGLVATRIMVSVLPRFYGEPYASFRDIIAVRITATA